jgi:hypothetical protein
VGEESAGDAEPKDATGRADTCALMLGPSSSRFTVAKRGIGCVAARLLEAVDFAWTTPSTKKKSASKKNSPGIDESMKSIVT